MNFYTSTSFRLAIAKLTRKPKDGYKSVVNDICEALNKMDDNFLRETNDRIRQEQNFRIVKLQAWQGTGTWQQRASSPSHITAN